MSRQEEQRGSKAFNLSQKVANNELERRRLFLENIKILREIRDEELYKDILGDEHGKWAGYLGDVEVYYSRWQVQRWIFILERLVDGFGLDPSTFFDIPESRLEEIAQHANSSNATFLVDSARTLIPQAWRDTIAELKGKPTSEICHHNYQVYEICRVCGSRHQVDETNSRET